jgi:predicted RNase H-like HicB family nuclease
LDETQAYSFVATYQRIPRGYLGRIVGFPGVISEGKNLEACRESLNDALREMILAYQQEGQPLPSGQPIFESLLVEA